jgi:cation:H+ antiporter
MHAVNGYIQSNLPVAIVALLVSFTILAKCASVFVGSSVTLANRFKIPKLIVGIILVSLATTAPELSVSLIAALRGMPDMALGNAIGSVICDDGLALALCGIFAVGGTITIMPGILKTSGIALILMELTLIAFILPDNKLSRPEGAVLLTLFVAYTIFLIVRYRKDTSPPPMEEKEEIHKPMPVIIILFIVSIAGIIFASEFIVSSATTIAHACHVPEAIIALTLVALGTSIPEVATCIVAARKGEGALAVGNIIGADIMNICWVAGASALANDLEISRREMFLMLPSMFIIVAAMFGMLLFGYNLTKKKGIALLTLYIIYLAVVFGLQ